MTKKPKMSAQIANKPRPFEKRAMKDLAIVNRMVIGGMNHAYLRVVAKIDVALAEAVQESDDYRRGLTDAKALAEREVQVIEPVE